MSDTQILATPTGCGSEVEAQRIFEFLSEDLNYTLPDIDLNGPEFELPSKEGILYDAVPKITIDELTSGEVNGAGVFDRIMKAVDAQLNSQFQKNRIVGDQYATAYISLTTAALSAGVQFLLGKDQSYWAAIRAQLEGRKAEIDAVTAAVNLETTKVSYGITLAQFAGQEAQYALTKMQGANADAQYCLTTSQTELVEKQILKQVVDTDTAEFNLTDLMPKQSETLTAQLNLLKEQLETATAQTLDMRTDGQPVAGSVGAQTALYKQQKIAYERDVDYKISKIYMDQWIAQKSIDEGLTAPLEFVNTKIDEVFKKLRLNANI